MKFGEHWYDRLWGHLLDAAEEVDQDKFDTLMDLRADFAEADGRDEVKASKVAFECWEKCNA